MNQDITSAENPLIIPEGYKQTEVGVIPEDWEVKPFGNLIKIRHGRNQKEVESINGPYPIFATGGQIGTATSFLYDKPSVLIGRKGTINRPRYADKPFWTVDTLFYSEILKHAEAKFIYYKFCMIDWMQYNEASGVPSLNASTIERVLVTFPELKEQSTIANALSDVDALLCELEKLIAKKQAIKTATMQQLLTGKTRLPAFAVHSEPVNEGSLHDGLVHTASPYEKTNHTENALKGQRKGTKPSELGEIPEDWEVKPFGELMKIRHGRTQKEVESINAPYPIFATGGQIGTATSFLYDKPSVLIGRKGTINKPRYADEPFWTVDTLFYSEILKHADPKFIYYKFCMIDWMQYNEASGVPSLNASTIEAVLVTFPELEEQTAIANILSDMDSEIQALTQRLAKTRQIKQGMMQALLTGKIRLPFEKTQVNGVEK